MAPLNRIAHINVPSLFMNYLLRLSILRCESGGEEGSWMKLLTFFDSGKTAGAKAYVIQLLMGADGSFVSNENMD